MLSLQNQEWILLTKKELLQHKPGILQLYTVSSQAIFRFSSAFCCPPEQHRKKPSITLQCWEFYVSSTQEWSILCCELIRQSKLLNSSKETIFCTVSLTTHAVLFTIPLLPLQMQIYQCNSAQSYRRKRWKEKCEKSSYCLLVQQLHTSFFPNCWYQDLRLEFKLQTWGFWFWHYTMKEK